MNYIPSDNNKYKEEWESKGGGSCGPAAIAALIEQPIEKVMEKWHGYEGFAPTKILRAVLGKFGWRSILTGNNCRNCTS